MLIPWSIARRAFLPAAILVALALGLPARADDDATVPDADAPTAAHEPEPLNLLEQGLVPVGGLLGTNFVIWGFDRWVIDADYARISPSSVAANFSHGFTWDADSFAVNQFGHPYQGGLYFNAARAAGFGFWSSVPYITLGSLQWELFMEVDPPAVNDVVTTTLGGMIVGEVLLRTALLIRDDSATGLERAARELGAAAIDPAGGLARVFSGEAFRHGAAPERFPFQLELSAGVDRVSLPDAVRGRFRTLHFETFLQHGELPLPGDEVAPFDLFTASIGVNIGDPAAATLLDVDGVLAGHPFGCGRGRCLIAAAQHFAYYDSPLFKVGTTAVGAGLYADVPIWRLAFDVEAELLGAPVGGFDSPHAEAYGPQYNMGPGAVARADVAIRYGRWRLSLDNRHFFIRTIHGAAGYESAGFSTLSLRIPIWQPFAVDVGAAFLNRLTMLEGAERELRAITVAQSHLVCSW